MIIWLKLKPLFLWMRHVTSDRRDSTSPSSLLHLLFLLFSVLFFLLLFSPYPFVLLPVFLSSVTRAFHTSSIHTLCSTFTQKKNILHWWPFFHLYFFSPSFCAVWVCIIEPPCLPHTHPHTYSHYHRCFLLSCTLLFLYFTPSFSSVLLSHWLPSYFPTLPLFLPLHLLTPLVLSQLGCGLDRSGPPLPSPRLQQQHQPQIQVIQQL